MTNSKALLQNYKRDQAIKIKEDRINFPFVLKDPAMRINQQPTQQA